MLLLLLLLLVHGAEQVQSLRAPSEQLRSRPRPHDVASASALHADALAAARKTAGRHGHTLTASSQQSAAPTPASGLILPSAFGADSTGKLDSTQAFARMIAALSNTTRAATPMMASGIHNLGGATLDLEGGTYLISAPLAMPDFRGNWRIRGGTLRASPSFPKNRFQLRLDPTAASRKTTKTFARSSSAWITSFWTAVTPQLAASRSRSRWAQRSDRRPSAPGLWMLVSASTKAMRQSSNPRGLRRIT